MKLNKCKHCGSDAFIGEGVQSCEYRVECSNSNHCKAWIRIYSIFKRYAVEAWNEVNKVED